MLNRYVFSLDLKVDDSILEVGITAISR